MSEPKIVEAVGHGKVDLSRFVNQVKPSISKVRVVKMRNGKVYEDRTVEFTPDGIHR